MHTCHYEEIDEQPIPDAATTLGDGTCGRASMTAREPEQAGREAILSDANLSKFTCPLNKA